MAAPTGYPSWVYNSTQNVSLIVQTVAEFNALTTPGTWTTTPFEADDDDEADTGFTITDTYLKNLLIEMRVQNYLIADGMQQKDDVQQRIRPDVAANDIALTAL